MTPRENVSLAGVTTFHLGGNARFFVSCESIEEVLEARAFARSKGIPFFVVGGGSNLLPKDTGYEGLLIQIRIPGVAYEKPDEVHTLAVANAGVAWDELVRDVGAQGLWGIENLAGIPGTVGAAPVQNIGAYGVELAETLQWVEALPPEGDEPVRLLLPELGLGYRDSRFKREKGWVLLRVALLLSTVPTPKLHYADLKKAESEGTVLATPEDIARAVRVIRAGKFPDLAVCGTAGSFFKNPVIDVAAAAALSSRFPGLPVFPAEWNQAKISLAWILDRAIGLRGFSIGKARLFERQPIVIVADAGASNADVEMLAREVERRVKEATGIDIEREVSTLS